MQVRATNNEYHVQWCCIVTREDLSYVGSVKANGPIYVYACFARKRLTRMKLLVTYKKLYCCHKRGVNDLDVNMTKVNQAKLTINDATNKATPTR